MPTYTVTGNDTLTIDGNVFNDFATDDTASITFPTEIATVKTGKNGNSLVAQNMQGYNGEATIKLARGSSDDQFLANKLAAQTQNFVGTPLMAGSFVKKLGDGQGNVISDVYSLGGGVISRISVLVGAALSVDSSDAVDAALWPCMARCTRNGEKVTPATFDPADARADYYEIAFAVIKENLGPLFQSLIAQLPEPLRAMIKAPAIQNTP